MGAWKNWYIGQVESGASSAQIERNRKRIHGTDADPLVQRLRRNAEVERLAALERDGILTIDEITEGEAV